MNLDFSVSEVHRTQVPVTEAFAGQLLHAIHEYTNYKYTCEQTPTGYLLNPSFRAFLRDNMYRNSFIPEITVTVSQDQGQTVLHMTGKPVKKNRIFLYIWTGVLLILGLIGAARFGLWNPPAGLIPMGMGIYGYLLGKLGTRFSFHTVVKAIARDFP